MAAETRDSKARDARDECTKVQRGNFVDLLRSGVKQVAAMAQCGIKRSTAKSIAKAVKKNDEGALRKLLDPRGNRAGRKPVMGLTETDMFLETAKRAERCGLSVSINQAKSIMGAITNDGRSRGFKSGVPSDHVIRKLRSERRDITVRTYRPKDIAKVRAESYPHVFTWRTQLESLNRRRPGILDRAERYWNVDETEVDSEKIRRERVLSSSKNRDGAKRVNGVGGGGKHVTDVVACNAAGDLAALFLIVAGRYTMSGWFDPLPLRADDVKIAPGGVDLRPYCSEDWFPSDGSVETSENGSMSSEIMPRFLEHLKKQTDKLYPHNCNTHTVVTMDNHASRSLAEITWLETAVKLLQEILLSPANTTHFMQPCDQDVNKELSAWRIRTKEALLLNGIIGTSTQQCKLIMAVESHKRLARSAIVKSFEIIGMWPILEFKFLDFFKEKHGDPADKHADGVAGEDAEEEVEGGAVGQGSRPRKSDAVVAAELQAILADNSKDAPRRLQEVAMKVQKDATCNSILQQVLRLNNMVVQTPRKPSKRMADGQLKTSGGIPAMYLTAEGLFAKFRAAEAAKEAEKARIAAEKVATAEKRAEDKVREAKRREERLARQAEKKRADEEAAVEKKRVAGEKKRVAAEKKQEEAAEKKRVAAQKKAGRKRAADEQEALRAVKRAKKGGAQIAMTAGRVPLPPVESHTVRERSVPLQESGLSGQCTGVCLPLPK